MLETVVKPWMGSIAGERHYIFQQDGVPAHNAKMTQDWLRVCLPEFFAKEIWPPSSPDCNPLDYFLWSECERETNAAPHTSVASLKPKIKMVMANLDRDTVAKACRRFRTRLEAMVAANSNFIKLLCNGLLYEKYIKILCKSEYNCACYFIFRLVINYSHFIASTLYVTFVNSD